MSRQEDEFDMSKAFEYMDLVIKASKGGLFGGLITDNTDPIEPRYEILGYGFELRPIEIKDSEGKIVKNDSRFSNLYSGGEKVNDLVFRKGGGGGKFRDGYCELIYYVQKNPHTQERHGFDFGNHVIINDLGDIVLSPNGVTDYPSHIGGNVGRLKDTYYDLVRREPIITASTSSGSVNGKKFIIFEHRYQWYNKDLPLGVYMLNKETCIYEKIDEIK